MHSSRIVIVLGLAIALALSLIPLKLAFEKLLEEQPELDSGEYLVAVTFPGIVGDLEKLVGKGRVVLVVTPEADPHHASLTPQGRRALSTALVVVTMGHTHIDLEIEKLKKRGAIPGVLIDITKLEGIRKPVLPDGRINYHELYCDPFNLETLMKAVARELARSGLDDQSLSERLEGILRDIESVKATTGILGGYTAIVSYAGLQPQVEWLGLQVVHYLAEDIDTSPSSNALRRARLLLASDIVVVVIAVNERGEPLTTTDAWLLREAEKLGRPVLKVRFCALATSTIDVLNETTYAAIELAKLLRSSR
ncbi:MAG: hypothetical protein QXS85_02285 [Acidilobaceae archaeon]